MAPDDPPALPDDHPEPDHSYRDEYREYLYEKYGAVHPTESEDGGPPWETWRDDPWLQDLSQWPPYPSDSYGDLNLDPDDLTSPYAILIAKARAGLRDQPNVQADVAARIGLDAHWVQVWVDQGPEHCTTTVALTLSGWAKGLYHDLTPVLCEHCGARVPQALIQRTVHGESTDGTPLVQFIAHCQICGNRQSVPR